MWTILQLHRPRSQEGLTSAREGASSDFQETEIKIVFLQFFIIIRLFEFGGDQTYTLQEKV